MKFALMIRLGNWMVRQDGLYHQTEHVDAKTQGQKARWVSWDKIPRKRRGTSTSPAPNFCIDNNNK